MPREHFSRLLVWGFPEKHVKFLIDNSETAWILAPNGVLTELFQEIPQ